MDDFDQKRFPPGELLRELQERSDDIDSVTIQVANGVYMKGPQGQQTYSKNAGAFIRMCDGTSRLIHRDDAAELLNDGILNRMKIPIVLLPLHEES